MNATIHDLSERRKVTKFVQLKTDMSAHQWGKRQDMQRAGWLYKKITKSGDVVMTFGEPAVQMAFIEPTGNVKKYQYGDEV